MSEIFATLVGGGALLLRKKDDLLPGPDLAAWMHRERVTMITLPPSALGALPSAALPSLATVIVPPCINKFYILDLQPANSFVAHAVGEGHTVFLVSWRNAGSGQSTLTWDDYLEGRYWNGRIVQVSNGTNESFRNAGLNNLEALYESQRTAERVFEKEHDMWVY